MENFTMVGFNYFDVTVGAIILLLAVKGFMNGVIKEVFGLAGLVGGVYFASRLAGDAATFIDKNFVHIENAALLKLFGFMSILIIIWLSATILGSIFSKLTSASGLGPMDRLLGFIAGGGKYFVIFALIVTALSNVTLIRENTQKYVKDSMLYPILYKAGTAIIHIDPASLGLTTTPMEKSVELNTTESSPSSKRDGQ
jgi:membrane protein required for colicin V production